MSEYAANIDLSSLHGSNGFKIRGEASYDTAGFAVSTAGDVNGDGLDDLVVASRWGSNHEGASGAAYIVYGSSAGFGSTFDLSSIDSANGSAFWKRTPAGRTTAVMISHQRRFPQQEM